MREIFPYRDDTNYYYIQTEGIERLDKMLLEFSDINKIREINLYNGNLNGSYIKEDKEIIKITETDYKL